MGSDSVEDNRKREVGAKSAIAIDALALAIWDRSRNLIQKARAEYESGELTPERAQALLIGLLEANHLYGSLEGRVEDGISAGHRIAKAFEIESARDRKEARKGNRFARSRVGS